MSHKISIIGCGWLGFPLGEALVKQGNEVRGTTTTAEKMIKLERAGIEPFLVDLDPDFNHEDLSVFESDTLIINLPPRNRNDQPGFHEKQLKSLRHRAIEGKVEHIIFISSTGVYPNINREVSEKDASSACTSRSGIPLLPLEEIFTSGNNPCTVIRFGGLFDETRHPGRFLAGKRDLSGADSPVNMIHREDCIGVITQIIEKNIRDLVLNACAPHHPTRKAFYEKEAHKLGMEPPHFSDEPKPFKIVSTKALQEKLDYSFKHDLSGYSSN